MKQSIYIKIVFILTFGGVLFSGYLSATKFFSDTCAFNESCPFFLGYPACYYGFLMFFVMFLVTLFALIKRNKIRKVKNVLRIISFLGILFAGYFTIGEIFSMYKSSFLGLSTCTYGLIFYILIFVASFIKRKDKENNFIE